MRRWKRAVGWSLLVLALAAWFLHFRPRSHPRYDEWYDPVLNISWRYDTQEGRTEQWTKEDGWTPVDLPGAGR